MLAAASILDRCRNYLRRGAEERAKAINATTTKPRR